MKASTRVEGLSIEMLLGLVIANDLYRANGERMTVTSVTDGRHMRASLHYIGNAGDVRLPKRHPTMIARELEKALGQDYDVVLEKTHIHIEYQPKSGVNQRARAKQS